MKRSVIIGSLIGISGSFFFIALSYVDWRFIDLDFSIAIAPIWRLRIIIFVLISTSFSITIPFVAHYFRDASEPSGYVAVYGWCGWFMCFVALPLESAAPAAGLFFVGIALSQYYCALVVLRAIIAGEARRELGRNIAKVSARLIEEWDLPRPR